MKKHRKLIGVSLCLTLSVCFVIGMLFGVDGIAAVRQETGPLKYVKYEFDSETGGVQKHDVVYELGKDVSAVRINDINDVGSIYKINYVPNEFVTPTEFSDNAVLVDLREDFEFAERGTLILIILNLDPDSEDFKTQANALGKYKIGDYWHFTLSLPQVFGACNVYSRGQLVARHGEIENYDFSNFNTNYDIKTDEYVSMTGRTDIPLTFYTRRNTLDNSLNNAQIVTVHYQSSGGAFSGVRKFPIIGADKKVKDVVDISQGLYLGFAILAAIVMAVLLALTVLKRTVAFVPDMAIAFGIFMLFMPQFVAFKAASLPLLTAGSGCAAPFVILGAAIISVGKNFKRFPAAFASSAIVLSSAFAAFAIPFVPFSASVALSVAADAVRCFGAACIAVFVALKFADRADNNALRLICPTWITVISITTVCCRAVLPVAADPLFWLYCAVTVATFVSVFKIFMETERRSRYLTDNLRTEVDNRLKDLQSIIVERDNLLRFVSHDMKKPLVSSVAFLDTILERERDAEQIKTLNIVKQKTGGVLNGLCEIAEYSRFGYIAEPSAVADLRAICADAFKFMRDDCAANGIVLENRVTDETLVYVKPHGLENAITNIIINAIEHADCTSVVLSVECAKNRIMLEIADNGKGISENIDVFGPYVSENVGTTNSGLGLYISKSIVQSMNGELSYRCNSDGTVFRISLMRA